MTTSTRAPAAPTVVDFETRLAIADAAMNVRLAEASAAIEVNTAHIPIDPIPHVDAAPIVTPPTLPCPYRTTIATVLWQARNHLQDRGWCTGALRDEQGAVCLMGAIRAAAPSPDAEASALSVLLDAIKRDFPETESVPRFNDGRANSFLAFRYLDHAAQLAHNRNL